MGQNILVRVAYKAHDDDSDLRNRNVMEFIGATLEEAVSKARTWAAQQPPRDAENKLSDPWVLERHDGGKDWTYVDHV